MANFYMSRMQSGAVVYGRLRGVCFINFHKYLGIKTPDMHQDCLSAALEEIRKLDDEPEIKVYFNDTPAKDFYGHW